MINYIVVIDEMPCGNHFPRDYFPQAFHFKQYANDLVKEIEGLSGKAHVVPRAQFTADILKLLSDRTISEIE